MHLETKKANHRHSPEVRCWPTLRLVCPCAKGLASTLSAGQSLINVKQKEPTPNYPFRVWCWPTLWLVCSCAMSLPSTLPAELIPI
jgi:hypothetical protein